MRQQSDKGIDTADLWLSLSYDQSHSRGQLLLRHALRAIERDIFAMIFSLFWKNADSEFEFADANLMMRVGESLHCVDLVTRVNARFPLCVGFLDFLPRPGLD